MNGKSSVWAAIIRLAIFGALIIMPNTAPFCADETNGYLKVDGACNLEFPQDHGPHPGYKTEWWYYTGNLSGPDDRRFGFQLTFFRSQIEPSKKKYSGRPARKSPWRTNQVILAHFAVTDISEEIHFSAEEIARQALKLAGAEQTGSSTRVFLKNWSMDLMPDKHLLKAQDGNFSVDLSLTPLKPPVLHGENGYSSKGSKVESASCYYSFTRLKASGQIRSEGQAFPVRGLAWMDHEFSTSPLEPDLAGWDWFSIQLDNETELMAYVLRKKNGGVSKASSGTFVEKSGKSVHLNSDDFVIENLDYWKSKETGAVYPSLWKMKVPSLGLELYLDPNLKDQEMQTHESTSVTYWEGSISADGIIRGKRVGGYGYAELTGYAGAFNEKM